MLRSMYSGISGMKVNQVKLDVIGNNIANVGTTGFKSSRATFSNMLNQNVSDAMAPSQKQGGVNAAQVGLGVQLASIDTVMTQGMMQPTSRSLDVAIDGDGFFMVSNGPTVYGDSTLEVNHRPGTHTITEQSLAGSGSQMMYSRDGAFTLDNDGNLLTGDGYRVMGYSLTNDDSAMNATAKNPNTVSTAGLDFKFGPGSQLNGYQVVLGAVGPGTATSCDVDKANKLIKVNGDFSTPGALTTAQVESAVNKGVSAAGISQSISVSGNPINISDLGSEKVIGGADSTAPGTIAFAGFTIGISEGSALNGYTFEIGEVAADDLSVDVNPDVKKILINADFVNKGALTGTGLKEAINAALSTAGIEQTVTVTGSPMNLANISGKTDKGEIAKAPGQTVTLGDKTGGVDGDFGGLALEFTDGAALNGYTITYGETKAGTATEVSVDPTNKAIKIHVDMDQPINETILTDKFNQAIKNQGLKGCEAKVIDKTADGKFVKSLDKTSIKLADGKDSTAPKSINIGGFTMEFPVTKGGVSPFDEYEIVIADVNETDLSVDVDPTKKKIVLKGDFMTPNAITKADLQAAINDELVAKGVVTDAVDGLKVLGQCKVYTGLSSSMVEGGDELKAPGSIAALGMNFEMTPGAGLNGYKVVVGSITAGTKTEAKVDEKNKTITINGDFTTPGATSSQNIQNALNKALQDKGINQGIKVTGTPLSISGTESETTNGGTPVQSIDGNGTINFVDATKELKSYDGSLKTLKIPDKVTLPGSDVELAVKSYTIDSNGIINGVLEDGRVAALGQIAMASFKNPEGLSNLGGNLYGSSVNSGTATLKSGVGTLGENNSSGYGDNLQGMLEMSNVDLAEQFTDMITASRAFQASSKMINTGDEILQEIINLKR